MFLIVQLLISFSNLIHPECIMQSGTKKMKRRNGIEVNTPLIISIRAVDMKIPRCGNSRNSPSLNSQRCSPGLKMILRDIVPSVFAQELVERRRDTNCRHIASSDIYISEKSQHAMIFPGILEVSEAEEQERASNTAIGGLAARKLLHA